MRGERRRPNLEQEKKTKCLREKTDDCVVMTGVTKLVEKRKRSEGTRRVLAWKGGRRHSYMNVAN